MNNVNKTLYIPLYGKAYVSKKGIILNDPTAVEIWNKEGFSLKGKSKSKWLAYYMAMRSRVIDDFVNEQIEKNPEAVVFSVPAAIVLILSVRRLPNKKDLPALREHTHTAYSATHVIDTSHLW